LLGFLVCCSSLVDEKLIGVGYPVKPVHERVHLSFQSPDIAVQRRECGGSDFWTTG
jgi:hypothetical protein